MTFAAALITIHALLAGALVHTLFGTHDIR